MKFFKRSGAAAGPGASPGPLILRPTGNGGAEPSWSSSNSSTPRTFGGGDPEAWLSGETASATLSQLSVALASGSPEDMRAEGEKGMVKGHGDSCVYVRNSDEETALAWVARHFARRALDRGSPIDASAAFTPQGNGSKTKLTSSNAARAETALRSAIDYGDGQSMVDIAASVVKCYGRFHAELPRLRALTWAARTLGERCCNGDFGTAKSVAWSEAATTSSPSRAPRAQESYDETSVQKLELEDWDDEDLEDTLGVSESSRAQ